MEYSLGLITRSQNYDLPFRARWVSKELWHPNQNGNFDEDGSYVLALPYSDDRELILDILRQGNEVEVISPSELRDKVRTKLNLALKIYK